MNVQLRTSFFNKLNRNMKKYLSALLLLLFLAGCQSDEARKRNFAGTYDVTIHLPEANKDLEKAKKDIEKEISQAKKDIRQDIEQTKDDLKEEFGNDNKLGDAVSNFVDGMGKFAEGMTDLGESLGKLGVDIGNGVLEGLQFRATFHEDGDVAFGKKARIRIGSDTNRWDVVDGKFYLWEDDTEKQVFEMKNLGNGNWDLIGENVIFHLEKVEK